MKLRLLVFPVLLGLTVCPAWGLNFTPRVETQMIDAYAIHFLSFEDGNQRVEYGPPKGWKYVGNTSKLSLEDPQNFQAQASFNALPVEKPGAFTDIALKNYKSMAQALIPADSQNVTLDEAVGQAPMGNREAYSVSQSYAYFGRKFCVRVIFVNLGKTCLQIVCSAPEDKFASFVNALDGSLYSWHWTDPK